MDSLDGALKGRVKVGWVGIVGSVVVDWKVLDVVAGAELKPIPDSPLDSLDDSAVEPIIDAGTSRRTSCLTIVCVSSISFGIVVVDAATYTAKDNNPNTTAMYGLSSLRPVENCIAYQGATGFCGRKSNSHRLATLALLLMALLEYHYSSKVVLPYFVQQRYSDHPANCHPDDMLHRIISI